ncbi:hypothetical protein GQ44DRAFT_733060 [Phaeosphaeriaceae sp. PMI808]|nr:hypothetical protein GQ44DRAFT_733060 [Phaeosphaeriaceae sp. PMI808]
MARIVDRVKLWPHASFKELCIATHLATWLFAWDDGLPAPQYIENCLSNSSENNDITSNPIITDFRPAGKAIAKYYNLESTEKEQQRQHGSLEKVVDEAKELINEAVRELDLADQSMMQKYSANSAEKANIQKIISSCKFACTGNLG